MIGKYTPSIKKIFKKNSKRTIDQFQGYKNITRYLTLKA